MRRSPLYALLVADSISLVGNVVAQLAVPWFVLETTESATLTALAVLVNFLPVVLAGFFGGVVVDRLGFRRASVVADLASAAAVAAIPLLDATTGIAVWQVMALVFVGALLDAPGATARQALFLDVAELGNLRMERATGIRGGIQQGSQLVGGPIGGLLVAQFGATTALWLDAASFLVSAGLVAGLVPAGRTVLPPEPSRRYLDELVEGLRFIWRQRVLRALVVTVLILNLLDAPWPVLMSVFAFDAYGSAAHLGVMYGVYGGFALAGSLTYGAVGHRLPRRLTLVGCFSVVPLVYLVMATLPPLPMALAALAVVGVFTGPLNPVILTIESDIVPVRLRGRVFGAVRASAWAAIPLGVMLGGVAVEATGVSWTFLGIGLCYLAVTAYGYINPAFREIDAPSPQEPAPATSQ